ncbi:MAG TPA: ATP-binding protein [Candidatus Bathyarchaeia archaeon]|nr:ATP-binding protein [Candidatus Bathyarchaeia archaeon]
MKLPLSLPLPFLKRKDKEQAKQTEGQPEKKPSELLAEGMVSIQDIIAPSAIEVDFDQLKIGNTYFRTLFISGYPRYVSANWLAPLINFDHSLDVSMFIYPIEGRSILDDLRRKIAEMEAEIQTDLERGRVVDPSTQAKLEDARSLQEELVKGIERFFQFSLYVTIPAPSIEELNHISKQIESTLGSLLIIPKHATLQMEEGFKTTIPICTDKLMITRNMDTTSLATTFPFTSSELTANEGILFGINEHNDSLIIFDRFTLENANSVVFAKSGAGKSYLVKLEALRSLMFGTEIIIIDPEAEYQTLSEAVGGQYIGFGFGSYAKINPFDLSTVYAEEENELNQKLLSLHSLFKVIMGVLNPSEEATLDRALVLAYKMKGITPDPATQKNEPPLMEDLYKALTGMEEPEARSLADRIEKFVKGSFRGIFDQHSNVDIQNSFTVFSLRDLEDTLRPIAMFILLDYIWTRIRREMKRRILIVDEAWYMMRYPDSANFLRSIAKRARKYYLGVTTITQDVEDFFTTEYGKEIVSNSSMQILMKQSSVAIDRLAEVFYLSEGEKNLLLAADVGEGLFFAGTNHVAIRVVASPEEHKLITSKPEELMRMAEEKRRKIEAAKRAGIGPIPAEQEVTEQEISDSTEIRPEAERVSPAEVASITARPK